MIHFDVCPCRRYSEITTMLYSEFYSKKSSSAVLWQKAEKHGWATQIKISVSLKKSLDRWLVMWGFWGYNDVHILYHLPQGFEWIPPCKAISLHVIYMSALLILQRPLVNAWNSLYTNGTAIFDLFTWGGHFNPYNVTQTHSIFSKL